MTTIPFDFAAGELLLVNKPLDWTSFDVVNKIKWALKKRYDKKIKVGHAGTLDPRATGLLLICTGKKTKELAALQAESKSYEGIIEIGATRPTYDSDSEIDKTFPFEHITEDAVKQALKQFEGEIMQVPPAHSAIRIKGKRAYEMARKGQEVVIEPRKVIIDKFEFKSFNSPEVEFDVSCSKGTYIRTLAHDLGEALDNGAYLKTLVRTRIGEHYLKDALELEQLLALINQPADESI